MMGLPLASIPGLVLQVNVSVYDNANPEQKAYANLTVTVRRNQNRPEFNTTDISVNILETELIGKAIATVTCTLNC
jgi:hypothetical protein